MQDTTLGELADKFDRFEKNLKRRMASVRARDLLSPDQTRRSERFDEKLKQIQGKLKAKCVASPSVNRELRELEIQNAMLLLTSSFDHWARRLDSGMIKRK
ncbi:hypothetical protein [Phyllobacterium zundukense]|uniref:Uncharacterized protein n=1 Tax=Phyllobacterium zundukense TaxID=1867719 RepID=A0A2N9W319_9HYPH|nr:hypothetical protein [Phyllobacterium zundukense]ATU94293.1 hypothetical protein BLM14_21310 [Phyllobacterium zundukense]PIO46137.1 hypothetical protein B5P45_03810 [Phyllobacterium zundukense]